MGRILESVKHSDSHHRPRRGLIARLDEAPQLPPHLTVIPPHGLASGDAVLRVLTPVEVPPPPIGLPHHDLQRERPLLAGPLGFLGSGEGEGPYQLLAFTILFGQDELPIDELPVV
jgi:hypothetical protein